MALDQLSLGSLYKHACEALSSVPDERLATCLDSDDPKRALQSLIATAKAKDFVEEQPAASMPDQDMDAVRLPQAGTEDLASARAPTSAIDARSEAPLPNHLDDHCMNDGPHGSEVGDLLQVIAQASLGSDTAALALEEQARERLLRAVDQWATRAAQRQQSREAARAIPAERGELDLIVARKLQAGGAVELPPAEAHHCLLSCIEHGKVQARHASGRDCVVVLGNTGAGKSAFINLLHGCSFELSEDDQMVVSDTSAVAELMRIGHTNQSETFAPQVWFACE